MGLFGRKGVHPHYNKNTGGKAPVRMNGFDSVTISMRQNIGAACEPVVKVGDEVKVGQLIGDSQAFMSAPIHASVSGKVTKIAEIISPSGEKSVAVTIQSDGLMTLSESVKPPVLESTEDFLKAVRMSGAVGLGGAGFPTHVKLKVPDGKVDKLLINAAECEPYITTDERECLDHTDEIIDGISTVAKFLNINSAVIGIEKNKPAAIDKLKSALQTFSGEVEIKVEPLKTIYPQGAEKVLIHSLTGRTVPEGGLPSDVGCIVMNVGTVAFLSRYFKTGKPLVSRTLTLDGGAVKNPMNLRVPVGVMIKDIIAFAGGLKEEPKKLILGGPMMGVSLSGDEYFISKCNNAVLALSENDVKNSKESACIRCGKCVSVCPMGLMPTALEAMQRSGDVEGLEQYHALTCIECGCCSFICPAKRNLVQRIKLGKAKVRDMHSERKKEAQKNG